MPIDASKYSLKLELIRKRRRRVWVVAGSFVPVLYCVYLVGGEDALNVAGYAMIGIFAVTGCLAFGARCPRCRAVFSRGPGLINPWRSQCGTCGLRLYEDP